MLHGAHAIDLDAWTGPGDAEQRSLLSILLLKLPNLALYALAAFALARLWRGERGEAAAGLWLANPAVLLFALMMGQNDGWTALAAVAALLFGMRALENSASSLRWASIAMLALAVGGAIKLSPVLLIPTFALVLGRGWHERALLASIGALAFVAFIGPFLTTGFFREHGLFGEQTGQTPDAPRWVLYVLYAAYLAAVLVIERRDRDRARVLLFAFVALHALLFVLPGWSPQRSVLFAGVLAAAVPARRVFAAPYLLVTAFGLVAALSHRNEIASDLFAPLSSRVALIPPLWQRGEVEPLHTTLFVAGAVTWFAALATLWVERVPALPSLRWSPAWGLALVALLPAYLTASFARLPSGIDVTAYNQPAPAIELAAGETLALSFVAGHDDLRSVSLRLEGEGAGATVRVLDREGQPLYERRQRLAPGEQRFDVGRTARAGGQPFRIELTPEGPLRLAASAVPEALVAAVAEAGGEPLPCVVPRYTLHHQTTWVVLLSDWRRQLADGWAVLVVSGVVVGATVVAAGRRR